MRPIDAHAHVGAWRTPDFAGRSTTFDDAVNVYTRWNWAGALLFPTDAAANAELLADVLRYKGPLPFRMGYWADHRAVGDAGRFAACLQDVAALKIHTSFTRTPADSPFWHPYLETARTAGLPVVVHCGKWREVAGFEHALAAAARFQDLAFVLSHMGGDSPGLVNAAIDEVLDRKLENVFFGTESIREPWLLEHAVARLGAGRLVFGSDYNLNHPEAFRRLAEVLDLTDEQRTLIMRDNINSLLPSKQRFF